MQTENKYQRSKIYKIISNSTSDVYYGSTIEDKLTNRLSKHRIGYKLWLNNKQNYVSSYEIMKFKDSKIILVRFLRVIQNMNYLHVNSTILKILNVLISVKQA